MTAKCQVSHLELEKEALPWVRKARVFVAGVRYAAMAQVSCSQGALVRVRRPSPQVADSAASTQEGSQVVAGVTEVGGGLAREAGPDGGGICSG